jgi:hypothetical protein
MEGLQITIASFKEATALQRALANALKGSASNIRLPKTTKEDVDISGLLDALLSVIADTEVENALFACSARAMFKGAKVDRDFFEIEENREHYYPIMLEVATANLGPFFKGAALKFMGPGAKSESLQNLTSKLQKSLFSPAG